MKPTGDDSPRDERANHSTARRTPDRAATGVATPIATRRGVDDNAESSRYCAAGRRQLTLGELDPRMDRETGSSPHSGVDG